MVFRAENFQGMLFKEQLFGLLWHLQSFAATGELVLQHGDKKGVLYLEEGETIHAQSGALTAQRALKYISIWNELAFVFVHGLLSPKRTIFLTLNQLFDVLEISIDHAGFERQFKNFKPLSIEVALRHFWCRRKQAYYESSTRFLNKSKPALP
jgi:hypothetical protein